MSEALTGLFGADAEEFAEALLSSFNTARLQEMLYYKLSMDIEDYAGADRRAKVLSIIIEANQRNYWRKLVLAALESNPGSPILATFAERIGLTSAEPGAFEAKVRPVIPFLDPDEWRARMAATEFRVCRIEVPTVGGSVFGTGFLVHNDAVMTNYHVVKPVIDGKARSEAVVLLFDYRVSGGKTVSEGTPHTLDTNWLIDHSPYDSYDTKSDPNFANRPTDHLDYALLRVKGQPGAKKIGKKSGPNGALRGYIEVPTQPPALAEGDPLMILQHPDAEPLKLAIETVAVLGSNKNGTRVRYKTNTLGGSSGSPCFTLDWKLAALHHAGDPKSEIGLQARYNQGIPMAAIRALMAERGTAANLGPPLE